MKRFWQTFLAIVATASMTAVSNAQWSPNGEIGSYQSILARAGYVDGNSGGYQAAMPNQMPVPTPPGTPMVYNGQPGQVTNGWTNGCPPTGVPVGNAPNGYISADCGGAVGPCGNGMMPGNRMMGNRMMGNRMMPGNRMMGNQMMGNQMVGSPVMGQAYAMPGGNSMVYNQGVGCGPVYAAPTYQTAPVYVPGRSIGQALRNQVKAANLVVGIFGVSYRRDYEDDVKLGYCSPGDFFSTDLDHGNMTGLGASISQRRANGTGWEAVYWGLDDGVDITIGGPTYTYLGGLANLDHIPSGASVYDIYNAGDNVRIYRNTEIHNFELNMLKNGGQYTTRTGHCATYELLGGFRLFQFDEDLRYVSNSSAGGYPVTTEYALEAENTLTGFQVGGRSEICLSNRLKLSKGGNVGIFNNRIQTRQRIFDETGYNPLIGSGAYAGTSYDLMDTKDDVAFLGQFELGLIYQMSCTSRLRAGYRALGIAGVALAGDQVPYDFTDLNAIQSANSNGSLLLHGFYYGAEFCF